MNKKNNILITIVIILSTIFCTSACSLNIGNLVSVKIDDATTKQSAGSSEEQNTSPATIKETEEETSKETTTATVDYYKNSEGYYIKTPKLPNIEIPKETSSDTIIQAAASIIDDAIYSAIADVTVMRRDDLSHETYLFEYDAEGHYAALDAAPKKLLDAGMEYGEQYKEFLATTKEFGDNVLQDSLTLYKAYIYVNPDLCSYFRFAYTGKGVRGSYFDPDRDGNYTVDMSNEQQVEELQTKMAIYETVINRIVEKMPEGLSTYDKYYYLAAVLAHQCHYTDMDNEDVRNESTSYGALIGKSAICEGYAQAYNRLCEAANLWCVRKVGMASNQSHMWNMIMLEDGTYNVDVTWCDSRSDSPIEADWYYDFIRTEQQFEKDGHRLDEGEKANGDAIYNPYGY